MQGIQTNLSSLTAQRNLNNTNTGLNSALQRLSSGFRINSAKDDAAGIAIASRFTAQINGYNQGVRNAADAISLAQTAEGSLDEISNNLQRIRELAVQASNATNTSVDRAALQTEVGQLQAEIRRVGKTQFNGSQVLGSARSFQVGANTDAAVNMITFSAGGSVKGYTDYGKAASTAASVGTVLDARKMISAVDNMLKNVNTNRAELGAIQNRFESVIRNGQTAAANLSASRGRIQDADFAAETASMTKFQILQQAGVSVLSQANSMPQSVLGLLR